MKWVCITKDWEHFTYGKIYEGDLNTTLLDIENDIGERHMPCLYGSEVIISKMNKRYYGPPTKRVYYFLTLEEWRDKQIDDVIKE